MKAYFLFSHYKSMEILSCNSDENGNKNIIFVEVNVMDISTKFQLHPPYSF